MCELIIERVLTYSSRAASSLHSVYKPERCQRSFYKACLLESHNHTCTSSWPPHTELAALETCCQLNAKHKPLVSASDPADTWTWRVDEICTCHSWHHAADVLCDSEQVCDSGRIQQLVLENTDCFDITSPTGTELTSNINKSHLFHH